MSRVYNFSAGPAVLPEEVLQQAAAEILDWHGSGSSIMEMSHRGKEFIEVAQQSEIDIWILVREVVHFQFLNQIGHDSFAGKNRGNYHHRGGICGDALDRFHAW